MLKPLFPGMGMGMGMGVGMGMVGLAGLGVGMVGGRSWDKLGLARLAGASWVC